MKIREFCAGTLLTLAWFPACGGDDGGGGESTSKAPSAAEMAQSCAATCQMQKTCLGTIGAGLDCAALCGADKFPERPDCDYAAMKAKLDQCTAGGCGAIVVCEAEALVICPPPGGAQPETGTCDDCERLGPCCTATLVPSGTDPATCSNFSRATCEASPAKATIAAGCTAVVAACPP